MCVQPRQRGAVTCTVGRYVQVVDRRQIEARIQTDHTPHGPWRLEIANGYLHWIILLLLLYYISLYTLTGHIAPTSRVHLSTRLCIRFHVQYAWSHPAHQLASLGSWLHPSVTATVPSQCTISWDTVTLQYQARRAARTRYTQ